MATNGTTPLDVPSEEEVAALSKSADEIAREFPFELPLSLPVKAHGETIDTLTLQLPTGADLFHSGGDLWPDGRDKPADLRRLFALVSRIAGVPESTVKQLSGQDLKTIEVLMGFFFQPSGKKLKRIFSILRTSGETSEP